MAMRIELGAPRARRWGTAVSVPVVVGTGAVLALLVQDAAAQGAGVMAGDRATRYGRPQGTSAAAVQPTLTGCSIRLPGGSSRDSGLADFYLSNEQGRSYLIAPSITVRQLYTDNVELAPDGEEDSAFVTGVIPAVTLCGSGSRVTGQVNYQAEGYYYAGDPDRNEIYHVLDASGRAELVRNHLFLDATAVHEQTPIDAEEPSSSDNALDTGNRTDATTFSISPSWRQQVGDAGIMTLRYTHRRRYYDNNPRSSTGGTIGDSYSHTYSAQLVNPPTVRDWTWRVAAREQQVHEDGEDTDYFGEASVELGRRVTEHIFLIGQAGRQHDYNEDGTTDRFGSTFWNAGLRWEDARTRAEARVGKQFFGTSYQASLTHIGPRLTTNISYTETPEKRSRDAIDDRAFDPGQDFGPGREPGLRPEDTNDDDVFVQKRLSARANYAIGRSNFAVSGYSDEREFIRTGETEDTVGLRASWRWQFAPRTRLIPEWRWERTEFEDGETDYEQRYQISLARLVGPTVQAGATLRHQFQNSSDPTDEYTENAIILEVTKIF